MFNLLSNAQDKIPPRTSCTIQRLQRNRYAEDDWRTWAVPIVSGHLFTSGLEIPRFFVLISVNFFILFLFC